MHLPSHYLNMFTYATRFEEGETVAQTSGAREGIAVVTLMTGSIVSGAWAMVFMSRDERELRTLLAISAINLLASPLVAYAILAPAARDRWTVIHSSRPAPIEANYRSMSPGYERVSRDIPNVVRRAGLSSLLLGTMTVSGGVGVVLSLMMFGAGLLLLPGLICALRIGCSGFNVLLRKTESMEAVRKNARFAKILNHVLLAAWGFALFICFITRATEEGSHAVTNGWLEICGIAIAYVLLSLWNAKLLRQAADLVSSFRAERTG